MKIMELTLPITVILLIVSALVTVFFGWMGARPYNPTKGPRMVPWRFLMLLACTFCILMIVHLLNVTGLKTDQPMRF